MEIYKWNRIDFEYHSAFASTNKVEQSFHFVELCINQNDISIV